MGFEHACSVKGPREDSGFSSELNPGITLVERIHHYCTKFHPKTKLMVSGIRHKLGAPSVHIQS